MNPSELTPFEYAALRDEAVRRAHELRREAIAHGWDAIFSALRRLLAHERGDTHAPQPAGAPPTLR